MSISKGTTTSASLNLAIDSAIKARLFAECEIRSERDKVHWTIKRLLTEFALRTLKPLNKEDEQRIATRSNGYETGNGHQATPKHKRQKVKPAA